MAIEIRTNEVYANVLDIITAGECPCLIGPSGIGKTQITAQVAAKMGVDLVPVHLMSMGPEDVKFPIVDVVNETVTFVPARMFLANGRRKMFFWDELTHASTVMQSIGYGVFEGNRLGDYALPQDAIHIAAHNRVQDKGVHNRVPIPLRRRWCELHVVPYMGDSGDGGWWDFANTNGIHPLIMGFLKWRPAHFYMDAETEDKVPDPRAWAKLSRILTATNRPLHTLHAIICGYVGEGVGTEFSSFLRFYKDLPDLDSIIASPKTSRVPEDNPASMYAIASGLSRKMTVANIGKVLTYLARMPAEFNIMSVRDAVLRDKALQSTSDLTKWAISNSDIVL